jgi:hypothetical protein
MKTIILLIIIQLYLNANTYIFNPLVLAPRNAVPVIGLSSGISSLNTNIKILSTNKLYNNIYLKNTTVSPYFSGYFGVENKIYRFSLSYDYINNSNIKYNEFLLNYDFKLKNNRRYNTFFGIGIGIGYTNYNINDASIHDNNSIISLRGGIEYLIDLHNSIDFLIEYTTSFTDYKGENYYNGLDYYEYNIDEQSNILFKIQYNFNF